MSFMVSVLYTKSSNYNMKLNASS